MSKYQRKYKFIYTYVKKVLMIYQILITFTWKIMLAKRVKDNLIKTKQYITKKKKRIM